MSVVEGVTIEASSAAIGMLMRLDSEDDKIGAAGFGDAIRRLDARDDLFACSSASLSLVFLHRLQALPARHDRHCSRGELGRNVAADALAPTIVMFIARFESTRQPITLIDSDSYHNEAKARVHSSGRRNRGLPQAVLRQTG